MYVLTLAHQSIILETLDKEERVLQHLGSSQSCWVGSPRCGRAWSGCMAAGAFYDPGAKSWLNLCPHLQDHRGSLPDCLQHRKQMGCRQPQGGWSERQWDHRGEFADLWYTPLNCWNMLYWFGIINKIKGPSLPDTWLCSLYRYFWIPRVTPKQCCWAICSLFPWTGTHLWTTCLGPLSIPIMRAWRHQYINFLIYYITKSNRAVVKNPTTKLGWKSLHLSWEFF